MMFRIDGHKVKKFAPPAGRQRHWRIVSSEGTNIAIKYCVTARRQMAYAQAYKRPRNGMSGKRCGRF